MIQKGIEVQIPQSPSFANSFTNPNGRSIINRILKTKAVLANCLGEGNFLILFCLSLKIVEFIQCVLKLSLIEICDSIHVFQLIDIFCLLGKPDRWRSFYNRFEFVFFFRKVFVQENRSSSVVRKTGFY